MTASVAPSKTEAGGSQPAVKVEVPSVQLEGAGDSENKVMPASFEEKLVNSNMKTLKKGDPVILIEDQGTFKPKLGQQKSKAINQAWSEVKQQSPPRIAESAVLEVSAVESEIGET